VKDCTNVPYDCGLYYFAKHGGQVHEMIGHIIHASLFDLPGNVVVLCTGEGVFFCMGQWERDAC
jgi:hypothetical protein